MHYGPLEYQLVSTVLDALSADEPRLRYAEWLAAQGDEPRARVVRASCPSSLDVGALGAALDALDSEHFAWSRLIGAQLMREICAQNLRPHLEPWLKLARPAFEMIVGPNEDAPVGASRLWGDPDLPMGTTWPTFGECLRWEEDIELADDDPCHFVAQVDLASLASSPAARVLPRQGLLSVFSHFEIERTASSALYLRHFPEKDSLRRVPHSETTSEENARMEPHRLTLKEALTIPDAGWGPSAARMGLAANDWDALEKHRAVLVASGGGLLGLLGHTRATSGADPAPGTDWWRLINVPVDVETWRHHVAIREDDLVAGRLDAHRLVWVDFDGE